MHWYLEVFRKGSDFGGRARRREYWMFTLVNFLIACGLGVLLVLTADQNGVSPVVWTSFAYSLITIVPSLAVTVRRLHDLDRSGGAMFINLVPLTGGIYFLVWLLTSGTPGDNRYGPDPKAVPAAEPGTIERVYELISAEQ